jgi:ABC-type Na+ efflux pump permease subunit
MAKLWRVAWNEFKRNVFTKGFILALLSLPLLMSVIFGMGILFEGREENNAPLGSVDESGNLSHPTPPLLEEPIEMIPFESEEAARKALEDNQIQAYYLIPPDYRKSRQVELFYLNEPQPRTVL